MTILIADLECDSLRPSVIHMVGVLDYESDEFYDYHGDEVVDGLMRLAEADRVVFYNGKGYDVPVIERLTEGLVIFRPEQIVECLDLSRRYVSMKNHKLKSWGELFDFPKGDHTDFTKWSKSMSIYCERDCRLTKLVFNLLNDMAIEKGHRSLIEGVRGV
jgi:hypothetical protein